MEPPQDMAIDVQEIVKSCGKQIHELELLQDAIDHEMGRLQACGFFDRKKPQKTQSFAQKFGNNSGFKLEDMIMKNKILPANCNRVLDLCGAPGGFCRVLARVRPNAEIVTVSSYCGDCTYKPSNVAGRHVAVICSESTGDVCTEKTWKKIGLKAGKRGFDLITADGSCASFNRWSSQERDNSALIERELRYVMMFSADGATALIKVFYGWQPTTCALYLAFSMMFEIVDIVKPEGSSPLSGEVYWIGRKFIPIDQRDGDYEPDVSEVKGYLKKLKQRMQHQLEFLKEAR